MYFQILMDQEDVTRVLDALLAVQSELLVEPDNAELCLAERLLETHRRIAEQHDDTLHKLARER